MYRVLQVRLSVLDYLRIRAFLVLQVIREIQSLLYRLSYQVDLLVQAIPVSQGLPEDRLVQLHLVDQEIHQHPKNFCEFGFMKFL